MLKNEGEVLCILPPHIAPLLPIIVEKLVPSPVGEYQGVSPEEEHEQEYNDVLGD